jgi:hypothetical protein
MDRQPSLSFRGAMGSASLPSNPMPKHAMNSARVPAFGCLAVVAATVLSGCGSGGDRRTDRAQSSRRPAAALNLERAYARHEGKPTEDVHCVPRVSDLAAKAGANWNCAVRNTASKAADRVSIRVDPGGAWETVQVLRPGAQPPSFAVTASGCCLPAGG